MRGRFHLALGYSRSSWRLVTVRHGVVYYLAGYLVSSSYWWLTRLACWLRNNVFEEVVVAQYEALFPYLPGKTRGNYKMCVTMDEGSTTVTHGRRKEILDFQTLFSVHAEIFLSQTTCTLCWFTCTLLTVSCVSTKNNDHPQREHWIKGA